MKAEFVKKLSGFSGDARLFKLSEPIEYDKPWDEEDPPAKRTNFVVVSAVIVPFTGPETYIFPADENGNIINYGELDGSYRGGLDHRHALESAGYEATP